MQRLLKFRVWHKKQKTFLTEGYWWVGMAAYSGFTVNEDEYKSEEIIVQQFTGLLDKNNKEIYEGDVVKFSTYNLYEFKSIITFEIGCFGYGEMTRFHNLSAWPYEKEIIGNIFQNSSLLT